MACSSALHLGLLRPACQKQADYRAGTVAVSLYSCAFDRFRPQPEINGVRKN
jgi:hypothetical protein